MARQYSEVEIVAVYADVLCWVFSEPIPADASPLVHELLAPVNSSENGS
jgi:hypothetical protein